MNFYLNMSGIEVIGGISAVISIIDASIKIYNGARKDMKLSEAFDAVGHRLPIIVEILQTCKKDVEQREQSMPANVCEALEKIIDACDEKAQRLREIFEKVMPGEKGAWERRYLKIFRRLGKGNKIEELMASITQDTQLLVNNHAVKSARLKQNAELEKIIDEMKSLKSSVPEDENLDMSFNSGGGAQTNNTNTGSGQQINNNAPVTTQNFHSGESKVNYQAKNMIFTKSGSRVREREDSNFFPSGRKAILLGRERDLQQLQSIVNDRREQIDDYKGKLIVVEGGIGYGKTQLCLTFAYRNRKRFKFCWLINSSSHSEIKRSFSSLVADLKMLHAMQEDRETSRLQLGDDVSYAKGWLENNENWMLIFDDADPNIDFEGHYFPDTPNGLIVINGRHPQLRAMLRNGSGMYHILHPLDQKNAVDLFERLLASQEDGIGPLQAHESNSLIEIVSALDHIPLAIELAVSRIRNIGRQIPVYERLDMYRRNWQNLLLKGKSVKDDHIPRATQVQDLLDSLENTKIDAQESVQQDALDLLRIFSRMGSEPLSISLLECSWKGWKKATILQEFEYRNFPRALKDSHAESFSEHSVQNAISLLDNLSLIQITGKREDRRITWNTFVRGHISLHMIQNSIDSREECFSTLAMLMQSLSWDDDSDRWAHARQILPHMQAALASLNEQITQLVPELCELAGLEAGFDIMLKIGAVYFQANFLDLAENLQTFTTSNARTRFGLRHRLTLKAMSETATTLMILDRPMDALHLRKEVFQVRKTICERQSSHLFALSCILQNGYYACRSWRWPTWKLIKPHFCSNNFMNQKRQPTTELLIDEFEPDIQTRNLRDYQQIAMNLADSLAAVPNLQDKQMALSIRRDVAFQRIMTLNTKPWEIDKGMFQRRIEATRKVAHSLHDLRQYSKSFYLRKKIHSLWHKKGLESHSKPHILTLQLTRELAESYADLGNDTAALELMGNVRDSVIQSLSLPGDDLNLILAESQLAHIHMANDNLLLSRHLYEEVEVKFQKLLGTQHRLSIDAGENVANVLARLRYFDEALEKQREAIRAKVKLYGARDEETLKSIENAVSLLVRDEVLSCFASKLQCYVINTRSLKKNGNEILLFSSLNKLADCMSCMRSSEGHYSESVDEGCKLCHKAQNLRSKILSAQASYATLGTSHPNTLETISGLADDYDMQCRFHMQSLRAVVSSPIKSMHAKVSISISERDPIDSATLSSVGSSDRVLQEVLNKEWSLFLKDDSVHDSVIASLPQYIGIDPILMTHDGSYSSSFETLKSRSLQLREYVLQKSIANAEVMKAASPESESWKDNNRFVRHAGAKLVQSRSLYGLNADTHDGHYSKTIHRWLVNTEFQDNDFDRSFLSPSPRPHDIPHSETKEEEYYDADTQLQLDESQE